MRTLTLVLIATAALAMVANAVPANDQQQNAAAMHSMTVAELEKAGDICRAQKDYAQAINYFKEALRKESTNPKLYNKLGLAELSSGDYTAAKADFAKATKYNRKYPDAWNDLGVVYYVEKNFATAVKYFSKAISLDETRPSFHVNLGVTYFAQNQMDRAMREYTRALQLDPDALMRSSNTGMSAQITDREQRAKHDYMMARIYAQLGDVDKCLVCLENAKENGYSELANVYKEDEFSRVRQDPRLATIIPPPIRK